MDIPLDDVDEIEVPGELADRIQRWADRQGYSYSQAVLELLDFALNVQHDEVTEDAHYS